MQVFIKYQNMQPKKLIGQKYFEEFNWFHEGWSVGDIIWVEDYRAADYRARAAVIFLGEDDGHIVLEAIPNSVAYEMDEAGVENIKQIYPTWILPKI